MQHLLQIAQELHLETTSLVQDFNSTISDLLAQLSREGLPQPTVKPLALKRKAKEVVKEGFVYAAWSPIAKNKVKIGFTRVSVEERLKLLNHVNIPMEMQYQIVTYLSTSDARKTESIIHKMLQEYRDTGNREFFNITKEQAQDIFASLAGDDDDVLESVQDMIPKMLKKEISQYLVDYVEPKKPKTICEHGKQERVCTMCKGKDLCQHSKKLRECKICEGGGGAYCIHGNREIHCKECGGSYICVHSKRRYNCKECKGGGAGGGFCVHGRSKQHCGDCGERKSYCEHGRQRSQCKPCGGSSLCIHGKRKFLCVDCKGVGTCEHGKVRKRCKLCPNNLLCPHGIEKYDCIPCEGSGICQHSKVRRKCKDCKAEKAQTKINDEP